MALTGYVLWSLGNVGGESSISDLTPTQPEPDLKFSGHVVTEGCPSTRSCLVGCERCWRNRQLASLHMTRNAGGEEPT